MKAITVKLDRTRTLAFKGRAVEAFQAETDRDIFAWFFELLQTIQQAQKDESRALEFGRYFPELVTLIWAGCLKEEPELSRDVVLDELGFPELQELLPTVIEALQRDLNMVVPENGKASPKKAAAKKAKS